MAVPVFTYQKLSPSLPHFPHSAPTLPSWIMSFTTLFFDSPKVLNSNIRYEDADVNYTIRTAQPNPSLRQITSLEGPPGRPKAMIDWKSRAFEIRGAKRFIEQLCTKRGTFSSSRYWSWFDAEEYKVKWEAEIEHTWTIHAYDGRVLASFTPKTRRLFHANTMPMLKISPSITDEDEEEFIILILLYSETKRMESLRKRPLSVFTRRRHKN
ncbi:hypothetical protein K438DRAFT_1952370 [Mycena galopus ATCC 62051]|nr:hypothetical protein K438DRAFT_1952370 [Mycena galopus ATCC 62051]